MKSETKIKKDGNTKSPTVKRPKEIQYSRLLFIQHYFNGTELKKSSDDKDEPQMEPVVDEDGNNDGDDAQANKDK